MTATAHAAVEVAGYRDMWRAAPAGLAARHGIAHADIGGGVALGCATLSGSPVFNSVIGLGLSEPADDAVLGEVAAFYAALGADYTVAADAAAPGLATALAHRGFAPRGRPWMTFGRTPTPAAEGRPGIAVADARAADAGDFGRIVAAAFQRPGDFAAWVTALVGRPGWSCMLARAGGEPVGAAALFADGDAGWFTLGGTLPGRRGLGAQGALFAARLARARELGLRRVVTETGAPVGDERPGPSYRNMLRAGFAEEGLRPNLAPPSAR